MKRSLMGALQRPTSARNCRDLAADKEYLAAKSCAGSWCCAFCKHKIHYKFFLYSKEYLTLLLEENATKKRPLKTNTICLVWNAASWGAPWSRASSFFNFNKAMCSRVSNQPFSSHIVCKLDYKYLAHITPLAQNSQLHISHQLHFSPPPAQHPRQQ